MIVSSYEILLRISLLSDNSPNTDSSKEITQMVYKSFICNENRAFKKIEKTLDKCI